MKIQTTWTYKNLGWVVAAGLFAGVLLHDVKLPEAEAITYQKQAQAVACDLDCLVEQKTLEVYERDRAIFMEQSRLQAIREMNVDLQDMVYLSPHIDYSELSPQSTADND